MPQSHRSVRDQQSGLSIITDSDALFALQDEWNALWSEADGLHNQSFTVCWLAWTHVAKPRGRKLHCIVYREKGELVLVWPLVSYRRAVWTMLEPLAPGTAETTNILTRGDAHAAIDAAWDAATRQCRADVFSVPYVSPDARLDTLASKHAGLVSATQDQSAFALLRGEPDWTAYRDSLLPLSKKKPAAVERRFTKEGALEVHVVESDDTLAHARWVDWMLARKREWAERGRKHGPWLYSQGYRDFLVDLLDGTRRKPLANVFVMTLDGAPVLVNLVGFGSTSASGLIAGFDPKFSKFSPGTIMMDRCVKWCWENKLDLDFGIGKEDFKAYWSRGNVLQNNSYQIATTHWGKLAFLVKDLAGKVSDLRKSHTGTDTVEPGKRPVG